MQDYIVVIIIIIAIIAATAILLLLMGRKIWKKRPLGRPKLRWEDNIRMDLRDIG
jgi:hypothetical protein